MDFTRLAVHLTDTAFTSRYSYEDALVLPLRSSTEVGASVVGGNEGDGADAWTGGAAPAASVATPWWLSAPSEGPLQPLAAQSSTLGPIERHTLGWRCPVCGTVEVETLAWMVRHKTDADLQKLHAVQEAAAKGSKTNLRRLQKEKLREKRCSAAPRCSRCYLCPRCSSQSAWTPPGTATAPGVCGAGHVGGLQVKLAALPKSDGGGGSTFAYHMACAFCQWKTFTGFASLHELVDCLAGMHAQKSSEGSLRLWRRAQRETNELLRGRYVPVAAPLPLRAASTAALAHGAAQPSYSLSRAAWRRYIELLGPTSHAPGAALAVDACGSTPAAGVRPSDGAETPESVEVPPFTLDVSGADGARDQTAREAARLRRTAREKETALMEEIRAGAVQRRTQRLLRDPLHPALALEGLRAMYERRQLYEGQWIGIEPSKLPQYVRSIACAEAAFLEEPLAVSSRSQVADADDVAPPSVEEQAVVGPGARADSDEGFLFGESQTCQWGLHPLFVRAAPDVEELQVLMLPSLTGYDAVASGLSAPTRTGLRKDTPLPGARDASQQQQQEQQQHSPRTAGKVSVNVLAAKPLLASVNRASSRVAGVAALEALLTQPVHQAWVRSLFSYYVQHPQKIPITALMCRVLPVGQLTAAESAYTPTEERFLLLDLDPACDEDVERIVRFWHPQERLDGNLAEDTDAAAESQLGTAPFPIDFLPAARYSAVRALPYVQCKGVGVRPPVESGDSAVYTVHLNVRALGPQTCVLCGLQLVRSRLWRGTRCALKAADTAPSPAAELPDPQRPETWVRLSPRCSATEAAVAGLVERASAALPASLLDSMGTAGTLPVSTWAFCVELTAPPSTTADEGPQFLGFRMDAIVFLPDLNTATELERRPSPAQGQYYRVSTGLSVVW